MRREAERRATTEVAAALADLEREEAELSRHDLLLRRRRDEAAGAARAPPGWSGEALQGAARALLRMRAEARELADRRDAQLVRVEEAQGAAERARDLLAVARAGRRGIEIHRERWAEERRHARRVALEAEQDDRAGTGVAGRPFGA